MKIKLKAVVLSLCTLGLVACNESKDSKNDSEASQELTSNTISLKKIGAFNTGIFGKSAAEIPAYDAKSKRAFIVNAEQGTLDVLDLSDPTHPKKINENLYCVQVRLSMPFLLKCR